MVPSHRQPLEPMPSPSVLTARLVGIGLNFDCEPELDADIEATLAFASIAGMLESQTRTLCVLTTWLGVHQRCLDARHPHDLVCDQACDRVLAYWASIAHWLRADTRFAPLEALYLGPPLDLYPFGTDFQIKRRGEDARFVHSKLRVAAGTLRDRPTDVLSPIQLARCRSGYRHRMSMCDRLGDSTLTTVA